MFLSFGLFCLLSHFLLNRMVLNLFCRLPEFVLSTDRGVRWTDEVSAGRTKCPWTDAASTGRTKCPLDGRNVRWTDKVSAGRTNKSQQNTSVNFVFLLVVCRNFMTQQSLSSRSRAPALHIQKSCVKAFALSIDTVTWKKIRKIRRREEEEEEK